VVSHNLDSLGFWFGSPHFVFLFLLIVLRMLHKIGTDCSATLVAIAISRVMQCNSILYFWLKKKKK